MAKKQTNDSVKFPHVRVKLSGTDGNAFAVLARVKAALRKAGASTASINVFLEDATSGDYDHLLQVCMQTVEVE